MKRLLLTTMALALALALAGPSPRAHAEELLEPARPRQGYWLAGGAHFALLHGFERGDQVGPMAGWQGTLRAGQLLTPRFGLGLFIDFGAASGDDNDAGFGGVAFEGQVVLLGNLSATAAIGLGVVSVTSPDDDDDVTRGAVGTGYTASLRYDWFVSPRRSGGLALTPTLSARFVPGDTDVIAGFLGVELTWWTGLPKNQLDLRDASAYTK